MEETDARPKKRGFLFAVIRFLRLRVVASVLAIVEIDGKQKNVPTVTQTITMPYICQFAQRAG